MLYTDILRISAQRKGIPNKLYYAPDKSGFPRTWKGQNDGTIKLIEPITAPQTNSGSTVPSSAETDPIFSLWLAGPPLISLFTNDSGYLTSFSETDPNWAAWLAGPPDLSEFNDDIGILTDLSSFSTTDLAEGTNLYFTDERAQDAIGAMVDSTIVYTDGTPLLSRAALTGDVTASAGSNTTTIPNDTVTYAKIQNVSATDKVLGRSTAGAGDIEEITCTSFGRALIDDASVAAQRATLSTRFVLHFECAASNPGDNQVVYWGVHSAVQPSTTANIEYRKIAQTCVIKEAVITVFVGGTLGTTETSTFAVNQNNTTVTTLSSAITMNAVIQSFVITGLSISITSGDTVEIKSTYPTWATNPTTARYIAELYCE